MRHKKDTTTQNTPLIDASAAESMRNDLDMLKEMAGAGEMSEAGYAPTSQIDDLAIDKDALRRKINILNKQLESHQNQRVTDPAKRNQITKRREELERKFQPYLETYRDLGVVRRDSPDWHPAFKKATERYKIEPFISEWKRLGLMLEPEDRFINDLNRLRKDS